LPDGTFVTIYRKDSCAPPQTFYYCETCDLSGDYTWYYFDTVTPCDVSSVTLEPGDAALLDLSYPFQVVFNGTSNIPALPLAFPCGCGHYYYLSRQTNDVGNFENITGLLPQEGSQFQRWNGSNFSVFTYSAGAWTPSVPSADVGEAVRILVSPCFSNTCLTLRMPTNIAITSWTNVPVTYAPMADDNCTNAPTPICTPKSGTLFAPGTTTLVHCLAVDAVGNGAVGDFTVTISFPKLELVSNGTAIILSWAGGGVLQEAEAPSGSWSDVPGGNVSPCTINQIGSGSGFYRLRFR
jgi:hypothetical protein